MNEKVAKKIGEAYAFSQVLIELYRKTSSVFNELLESHTATLTHTASEQITQLNIVAEAGGMGDVVREKATRTGEKITEMGEFYVGDDWSDSAEVLEWLSFFLGAAVIHWQLIAGAAQELSDDSFERTARDGAAYYAALLDVARVKAEAIGHARAQG
jgi:hypothetical protein